MTPQELKKQADHLIMRCYEIENGVNLHGYTPRPNTAPDYLRAKRKALKLAKQHHNTPLYNLLKSNY